MLGFKGNGCRTTINILSNMQIKPIDSVTQQRRIRDPAVKNKRASQTGDQAGDQAAGQAGDQAASQLGSQAASQPGKRPAQAGPENGCLLIEI